MFFEYDPEKSAANKTKHGIDFEEAPEIWTDPWLVEAPANTEDEPHFLVIGKVRDKHWAAACVHRGDHIRIISVRRARKQEIERYESL